MECTRGKLRTCEPHPVPVRAVGEAQGGVADCVEGPRSCRGDARPPTVSSEHRPDENQTDGDCTTTNTPRATKYAPQWWTLLRQTCPSSPWPFASHIQTFVKRAATNWSLVPCPGPSGPFQRPSPAPREVNQANHPQPAPLPSEGPGTHPALHSSPARCNTNSLTAGVCSQFKPCAVRLLTTRFSARLLPSCIPHLSNSQGASPKNSQPSNLAQL